MMIDGGIPRISSQSVSDRPRLKIGRCLVIGREICCPGRTKLHRDLGRIPSRETVKIEEPQLKVLDSVNALQQFIRICQALLFLASHACNEREE
jgi:hypothetical protein